MKSILTFFYTICLFTSFSQSTKLTLDWEVITVVNNEGNDLKFSQVKDQGLDNGVPTFYYMSNKEIKGKPELVEVLSEVAPEIDKTQLKILNVSIPTTPRVDFKLTTAGNDKFFVVYSIPYFYENNVLKRITGLTFNWQLSSNQAVVTKDFKSESVLKPGSGQWYKISVKEDGIYKIDKQFLSQCGINVQNLNPNHIHIYGNGEGMLPELNSITRIDDLENNSIYIKGDADGKFDDEDYVLFYGWGPHRWIANGTAEFDQRRNVYSDFSYYFININSSVSPKRIQFNPSNDFTENVAVTSYDFRDVHEEDLKNLVQGGKRWYGETFDVDLERTFSFSVPNIDNQVARFKIAIASNASSSGGNLQRYSLNGNLLHESVLPVSGGVDYARTIRSFSLNNPPSSIPLKMTIVRNNPNVVTYLDRILLNCRRNLVFTGTQFGFRNLTDANASLIAKYRISNFPSNGMVWDLSDRNHPKWQQGFYEGTDFVFKTDFGYKEFVASNGANFLIPERVGSIANQNLHALPQADYLIVTHQDFITQANRLADLHREEGMSVNVVTTEQVFNEFSSGASDAVAIRMFAKMFYDRGALNPETKPKYLLLFGDGTYDPKNRVSNNNNYVLTYQVDESENHISALVTDDFYGMLDDNEAISGNDLLDIGVGRMLISDLTQAKQQVDKVEHYMKNGSTLFDSQNSNCCMGEVTGKTFGDWRQKFVQVADDEENGYFLFNDTEPQYNWVKKFHQEMNCDKLYMDAFPQVTTAGGHRYPDVFNAITNNVQRGALIINYVGHGGEVGLAEERVVTIPQIQSWSNSNALNLFVSATCEFTKYDDPARVSAGEWVALNPNGGAIALMTTSRSVYFGVNSNTGMAFYKNVFTRNADGTPLTFGEIVRRTKNEAGNSDNKRSFTLIGDPALKIALPSLKVVTDSINGKSPSVQIETLQALSRVTIKGHLEDNAGQKVNNFNGVLVPSIFDKVKIQQTLGQDPKSPIVPFETQKNIIYKGKASVVNGDFEFTFVVPKDIDLALGKGKISYYAYSDNTDAGGYDTTFMVGGINTNGIVDNVGPDLTAFMNDEKFIDGSITGSSPVLLVKAFDENGINTVGSGIGHDIIAILDGEVSKPIVLNDFYASNLDDYQRGEIRYPFSDLSEGKHSVEIKVWDVNNNSSVVKVNFEVKSNNQADIKHLLNYPNPFTTKTAFMFEHNQSCSELKANIQIYSISGKLVKSIHQDISTRGFRVDGIEWDGKDEFGEQLAKGVYIYRLKIVLPDGKTAEKTEKLVILR